MCVSCSTKKNLRNCSHFIALILNKREIQKQIYSSMKSSLGASELVGGVSCCELGSLPIVYLCGFMNEMNNPACLFVFYFYECL